MGLFDFFSGIGKAVTTFFNPPKTSMPTPPPAQKPSPPPASKPPMPSLPGMPSPLQQMMSKAPTPPPIMGPVQIKPGESKEQYAARVGTPSAPKLTPPPLAAALGAKPSTIPPSTTVTKPTTPFAQPSITSTLPMKGMPALTKETVAAPMQTKVPLTPVTPTTISPIEQMLINSGKTVQAAALYKQRTGNVLPVPTAKPEMKKVTLPAPPALSAVKPVPAVSKAPVMGPTAPQAIGKSKLSPVEHNKLYKQRTKTSMEGVPSSLAVFKTVSSTAKSTAPVPTKPLEPTYLPPGTMGPFAKGTASWEQSPEFQSWLNSKEGQSTLANTLQSKAKVGMFGPDVALNVAKGLNAYGQPLRKDQMGNYIVSGALGPKVSQKEMDRLKGAYSSAIADLLAEKYKDKQIKDLTDTRQKYDRIINNLNKISEINKPLSKPMAALAKKFEERRDQLTTEPKVFDKQNAIQEIFYNNKSLLDDASNNYSKAAQSLRDTQFDPNLTYTIYDEKTNATTQMSGSAAQQWAQQKITDYDKLSNEYQQKSNELLRAGIDASTEWHPDTKVTRNIMGEYQIDFPYAGAEHYGSLKQSLDQSGFGGLLATAFTPEDPLGLTSAFYTATGNKQAAIDSKIKSMARVQHMEDIRTGKIEGKGLGDWFMEAGSWYIENPITQIGLSAVGGEVIGKGVGFASGYLTGAGRLGAVQALKYGTKAAGGLMVVPSGISIYSDVQAGKGGEALGKAGVLGLSFIGGLGAGKEGMAESFKSGAKKGFDKYLLKNYTEGKLVPTDVNPNLKLDPKAYSSKNIFAKGKELNADRLELQNDILKRFGGAETIKQEIPQLDMIKAVQDYPEFGLYAKGKIPGMRDYKIYGSAARGKLNPNDLDIMVGPKASAEFKFAIEKITGKPFGEVKLGDIHYIGEQRPGRIVGEFGAVAEPAYKFELPEGKLLTSRYTEEWSRLSGSSLRPAHTGRIKDFDEALRMLDVIYEGQDIPPSLRKTITRYKQNMEYFKEMGENNPLIHTPSEYQSIYESPTLRSRLYSFEEKVLQKVVPKEIREAELGKFIEKGKTTQWVEKGKATTLETKPQSRFREFIKSEEGTQPLPGAKKYTTKGMTAEERLSFGYKEPKAKITPEEAEMDILARSMDKKGFFKKLRPMGEEGTQPLPGARKYIAKEVEVPRTRQSSLQSELEGGYAPPSPSPRFAIPSTSLGGIALGPSTIFKSTSLSPRVSSPAVKPIYPKKSTSYTPRKASLYPRSVSPYPSVSPSVAPSSLYAPYESPKPYSPSTSPSPSPSISPSPSVSPPSPSVSVSPPSPSPSVYPPISGIGLPGGGGSGVGGGGKGEGYSPRGYKERKWDVPDIWGAAKRTPFTTKPTFTKLTK